MGVPLSPQIETPHFQGNTFNIVEQHSYLSWEEHFSLLGIQYFLGFNGALRVKTDQNETYIVEDRGILGMRTM
jgi:hypothetical protein